MKAITWCVIIAVIVVSILVVLSGCASTPIIEVPPPTQVLYETVLKTNWLATAAIIGIAISAFTFLNGNKAGIAGMVACFIALTMTLAVARYAQWLAIGGLTGSIGLMIYSIFVKDRALEEIVKGGQEVKDVLLEHSLTKPPDDYTIKGTFNGVQKYNQSSQTTKLVKKIKKGIK